MFPGAHAQIYRNEAGEVLGWDNNAYFEPDYDPFDLDDDDDYEDDDVDTEGDYEYNDKGTIGKCTMCGAVETKLNRVSGFVAIPEESDHYPIGYGCELCD